jgi:hypothetical protein
MRSDMALTRTKAQLLILLQDLRDDAKIYAMATKKSVDKAVEAASRTVENGVFLQIATSKMQAKVGRRLGSVVV